MIGSLRQRHLLPMCAPAAILRRIGRVDLEELSASFFRFAGQLGEKGRPCRVTDAFRQTMIMNHPVDRQVFNGNDAESVNDGTRLLMSEIVAPELDPLVNTSYDLAMLAPRARPFGK